MCNNVTIREECLVDPADLDLDYRMRDASLPWSEEKRVHAGIMHAYSRSHRKVRDPAYDINSISR